MRKLAKVANVSPTTIYNNFQTKGNLRSYLIIEDFLNDLSKLGRTPDVSDNLNDTLALIDEIYQLTQTKSDFIREMISGILLSNEALDTQPIYQRITEQMQLWIRNKIEQGHIHPSTDVINLSHHLMCQLTANMLFWLGKTQSFEQLAIQIRLSLLNALYRHFDETWKEKSLALLEELEELEELEGSGD